MRRIRPATLSAPKRVRPRRARWLLASALCAALAAPALAADPALDRAAALITARDAATAYAELAPQERARAGDPRFDYLLGLAALDSGHVTHAIFALERVLARRPNDQPARAELARAYLAAGESDNARAELERVRGTEMPAEAAAAIDRVLGLLDQVAPSGRPRWSGYAELGAGHDSNVNSATNAGQFAIPAFGGLVFDVAAGSGRTSDNFGTVAGGASVQWPIAPAWNLFANVDARSNLNATAHDLNTSLAGASIGAGHIEGAHAQTVALQTNAAWLASSLYRTANGASAQWQSQLDAVSQAGVFAQWSRLTYNGARERDADRSVLGLAYARNFDATATLLYTSLYGADERARSGDFAQYGHHAIGGRLGAEQRWGAATTLFAEWQYERRRYGGTEPLFELRRIDRQTDLLVGLRVDLASSWQLVPQIRRTVAASNVVLYDYARTVFQLSLRKDFK